MPDYTDRAYPRVDIGAGTARPAVGHELLTGNTLHPRAPDWPNLPERRASRLERIIAPRWLSAWVAGFIWGVLLGGLVAAYLVRGPLP